ncbi:MAG: hypothetical protein LH473_01485 [Chitinophagales bacterium]|nr:hypothetical protein [Chitinophagales bacterium]
MTIVTLEIQNKQAIKSIRTIEEKKMVKVGRVRKTTVEQELFLRGLKQSFKEVKLHEQGKLKMKSARELLNEI